MHVDLPCRIEAGATQRLARTGGERAWALVIMSI
jgi:hypothetical protein